MDENEKEIRIENLRKMYFPQGVDTSAEHVRINFGAWMRSRGLNPDLPIHRQRFRTHIMKLMPDEWKDDARTEALVSMITCWFPGIKRFLVVETQTTEPSDRMPLWSRPKVRFLKPRLRVRR